MSFRKRNAALARRNSNVQDQILEESPAKGVAFHHEQIANGVRASPADGRLTTSTGTYSLDGLLAGHAGLPLGHGICVEETGTTDYAGALLRCYAAEGVMQGHIIHVIGAGPPWIKELPAVVEGRNESRETAKAQEAERMKIAWRYERLGNVNDRGTPSLDSVHEAFYLALESHVKSSYCLASDMRSITYFLKHPSSAVSAKSLTSRPFQ